MRWLFPGQEVRIDAACLDCGDPIVVRMRDEEILEVTPPETVGHTVRSFVKRSAETSAFR
ncbi:MAG: hypothetical protein IT301_17170 [Dehalococcoidia bacterium]|nr:hypothetical protein [Dehalococcoidia bacterium]